MTGTSAFRPPAVGDRTVSEGEAVRRLLQRVGLGPRRDELDAARAAGFDATLAGLVSPPGRDPGVAATPPPALPSHEPPARKNDQEARKEQRRDAAAESRRLGVWWLDRMAAADEPFPERMAWFWHGHFATSAQKVRYPQLMFGQNETLRRLGRGDFRALAGAMIVDPAMLVWLDGGGNRVGKPNENLAREFMELFTLGVGNYTEDDVREAARALTGWRVDVRSGTARFDPDDHDAGAKSLLGTTAGYDAHGPAADVHAGEVEVQLGSPVGLVQVGRAAVLRAADVVDQHVQATERVLRGGDHLADLVGVRDVAGVALRDPAGVGDQLQCRLQRCRIAVHGQHPRALTGEHVSRRAAVAPAGADAARAGDDRDLSLEPAGHHAASSSLSVVVGSESGVVPGGSSPTSLSRRAMAWPSRRIVTCGRATDVQMCGGRTIASLRRDVKGWGRRTACRGGRHGDGRMPRCPDKTRM